MNNSKQTQEADEECTKALARFYPIMKANMGKVYKFIRNTPYISDIRKEFYCFMLTQRSDKIITASYEKLEREGKIDINEEKADRTHKKTIDYPTDT